MSRENGARMNHRLGVVCDYRGPQIVTIRFSYSFALDFDIADATGLCLDN